MACGSGGSGGDARDSSGGSSAPQGGASDGGASNGGSGQAGTAGTIDPGAANGQTLPDGTSCAPAPAELEGAEATWNVFLDWHDDHAEACDITETWPSYECINKLYDPRRLADFTACLMADGCSTISAEDSCLIDPPSISDADVERALSPFQPWLDDVCFPKSDECGFSDDHCGLIAMQVARPEFRCAMLECLEGPCTAFDACLAALEVAMAPCE